MGLSSRSLPSIISARPTHELYKSCFSSFRSSLSLCPAAPHPRTRASLRLPAPPTPAMISTSRPPSVHSSNADADPFSALLRPPASETDHERVARLQREAGSKRFMVISSMGANPHSMIFYSRTKGLMEVNLSFSEEPCFRRKVCK